MNIRAKVADNFFSRLKGLLGTNEFPYADALYFPNVASIHTFFMKYPIDVVFLDKNNKVVGFRENVKPFRVVFGGMSAYLVVEMPQGSIKRMDINFGDILNIEGY